MFTTEKEVDQSRTVVKLREMEPCDIGRIVELGSPQFNHIVMRTASKSSFEVMNLSYPGADNCWTLSTCITAPLGAVWILDTFEILGKVQVELLPAGSTITLKVVE